MFWVKYFRLVCAVIRAVLTVCFRFPRLTRADKLRAIQDWSISVLAILNIEVNAHEKEPICEQRSALLLVANHVSWIDVLVIQSIAPSLFVAKQEVRSWPVIGWLAQACGVIFVDRSSVHAVKDMVQHVTHALQQGYNVAGFPEGTSTEGKTVQLFHANMFEAALQTHACVQPIALRYRHRACQRLSTDVAFVGDSGFLASLHQVMRTTHLIANVRFERRLPPLGHSRRTLAYLSHQCVSTALACM